MPDIATKVLSMVDSNDFGFNSLEKVISVDPGLTSKILRISNSAMYARQNAVTSLQTAISLLGIKTIKNIVILVTGSSLFSTAKKSKFYQFFWKHSLVTAFMSRDLAIKNGSKSQADEAFVAGLLHNIGQVAFFYSDQSLYESLIIKAASGQSRISQLEIDAFGTSHKEVGHQVLEAWNFPAVYTDTALEHGNNNIVSEHKQTIIFVSTADFMASNIDILKNNPKDFQLLDPYLPFLSLDRAQLEAFQNAYMDTLSKDKLFQECHELFSLQ